MLFDQYYTLLQSDAFTNRDTLDYLVNVDASTEDKFEMVVKNIASEKEIENYLRQCWRYNYVHKQTSNNYNSNDKIGSDSSVSILFFHNDIIDSTYKTTSTLDSTSKASLLRHLTKYARGLTVLLGQTNKNVIQSGRKTSLRSLCTSFPSGRQFHLRTLR